MRLPVSYWTTEMADAVDSGMGSYTSGKVWLILRRLWLLPWFGDGSQPDYKITWCFRAQALDSRWGFESPPVL